MKPFSESCVQNCTPIIRVIKRLLASCETVLEVGSGTGQHAVYFSTEMRHLTWYTSDREQNHKGIQQWLDEAKLDTIKPPIVLDVCNKQAWRNLDKSFDAVFSANTLHIMSASDVECFFSEVATVLKSQGLFIVYGPFNYRGGYTSESNARFDVWLKRQNADSAIRDSEWIDVLAEKSGMQRIHDYEMPANNRILVWQKNKRKSNDK
jgi:cyclopropane fatty-acyl-phospholipid synthase-like methyltransferase